MANVPSSRIITFSCIPNQYIGICSSRSDHMREKWVLIQRIERLKPSMAIQLEKWCPFARSWVPNEYSPIVSSTVKGSWTCIIRYHYLRRGSMPTSEFFYWFNGSGLISRRTVTRRRLLQIPNADQTIIRRAQEVSSIIMGPRQTPTDEKWDSSLTQLLNYPLVVCPDSLAITAPIPSFSLIEPLIGMAERCIGSKTITSPDEVIQAPSRFSISLRETWALWMVTGRIDRISHTCELRQRELVYVERS